MATISNNTEKKPNATNTPFSVDQNPNETQTLNPAPEPQLHLQPKATPGSADAPLSDVEKKIRRAERFGISVQLSEQEKRNSRAQRYNLFPLHFNLKKKKMLFGQSYLGVDWRRRFMCKWVEISPTWLGNSDLHMNR